MPFEHLREKRNPTVRLSALIVQDVLFLIKCVTLLGHMSVLSTGYKGYV